MKTPNGTPSRRKGSAVLDAYTWTDIEVPPFYPRTEADHKALDHFADEVIDRLYLLNVTRAAEETRLGKGKKKGKGKTKKRPKNDDQGELFSPSGKD